MNVSEIKKLAKELQEYTRIVGSRNEHIQGVAKRLVELTEQPQLNENQQIVLEWLKEEKTNSSLTAFDCIYSFIYGNPKDIVTQIWSELNAKEEAQVLEAFGKWAQEQGEE